MAIETRQSCVLLILCLLLVTAPAASARLQILMTHMVAPFEVISPAPAPATTARQQTLLTNMVAPFEVTSPVQAPATPAHHSCQDKCPEGLLCMVRCFFTGSPADDRQAQTNAATPSGSTAP